MTGAAPSAPPAEALGAAIARHLSRHLLPFWRLRGPDPVRGGFVAEIAHDGSVRHDAPRGLILNARLLWTFSALDRQLGDPRDRALAQRAYDTLEGRFHDRQHGGYRWRVDAEGSELAGAKKVYGQAFCIYALAEHYLATGRDEALAAAREVYHRIEVHARDPRHLGYLEALSADWSPTSDLRLSDKDRHAAKSMNTHLHLLEAYTNLYRAWPDPGLAARLAELLDLFGERILERVGDRHRLVHFFDADWAPLSDTNTWGHDIEAAWLLGEAAEVLGSEQRRAAVDRWAVGLARTVLAEAQDEEGGLAYEGRAGAVIDPNREWWCQAEAVVGFWHAYQLTGEERFAEAAARVWRFIEARFVDRVGGEWFWRVFPDGSPDVGEPKVSEWKGPYHNVRMCLEMIRRTGSGGER